MMSGFVRAVRLFFSEITVEPVLFLYMLSTFSQYALFQDLVYSKVCWTLYSPGVCEDLHAEKWATELEIVQKQSSYWILMSTVSLVIPSILIAIYLGSWSDRFGRKWPVVFPPFGGILACCVYIVLSFQHEAPVGWICLASFLSGLSGGFVSCIMSCMTYVAAISSQENRTVRISRLEAMIFLGGTVGPFLSGSMLQITGHGYAFLFMLIAYAVAFFYAIFFVNEVNENSSNSNGIKAAGITPPILASKGILEGSVKDIEQSQRLLGNTVLDNLPDVAQSAVYVSRRSVESGEDCSTSTTTTTTSCSDEEGRNILRSSSECEAENLEISRASSCCSQYFGSSHFLSAVKTVFKERPGARRAYLLLIILASYTVMMITAGELDVAYLFARGDPLRWTYQIYSYYFGFKYGLGTIVLLVGMPLIQHFMLRDSTICILGIFSRMAGLIMYALSTNTTIAFFVPVVAIFSSFTIPATRSLLSKLVSPDEQGKMFAFVAIMEDLCTLTASVLFNSVYPLTRPILKGFIFLMAAALLLIPLIIMIIVRYRLGRLGVEKEVSSSSTDSEGGGIANGIASTTHTPISTLSSQTQTTQVEGEC